MFKGGGSARTLTIAKAGDDSINGGIDPNSAFDSKAFNLIKDGSGTLFLTADSGVTPTNKWNSTLTITNGGTIGNGTGTINMEKTGGGTLTLSKDNTYIGTMTADAGTLSINGIQSAATGNVGVTNAGTRLIGTGTVGGGTTINADAIHSAGGAVANVNKVGKQAFIQNLTYADGSIFEWDLNANKDTDELDDNAGLTADNGVRGADFDAVDITGNLNISATAIFKVIVGSGVNFASVDNFWTKNQE